MCVAKHWLSLRAGDHWMGEIIKVEEMPELVLKVEGTAPIRSVDLVIDGKVVETTSPNEKRIELRRQPEISGAHYIYYHVVQTDGNEAWSSPLWVDVGTQRSD